MVAGHQHPPADRYVRSPHPYDGSGPAVFLAGGITSCPDWQTRAALQLRSAGVTARILNPWRADFSEGNPVAAREQIAWEHEHLHRADAVLFCAESIQPIALVRTGRPRRTRSHDRGRRALGARPPSRRRRTARQIHRPPTATAPPPRRCSTPS
ncbi:nucleoside 2-deoxyribosyltransferase domain-containing protein [Streptomyces abikoensis]|uniref:nucleoside 2-deoxyribosyltransferase domain-containing protein n=1 Tax=Streptomyces abikoensis TaxID=97398 RepID=UPI00167270FE